MRSARSGGAASAAPGAVRAREGAEFSQPKSARVSHGPVGCARQRRRHDALGWY